MENRLSARPFLVCVLSGAWCDMLSAGDGFVMASGFTVVRRLF